MCTVISTGNLKQSEISGRNSTKPEVFMISSKDHGLMSQPKLGQDYYIVLINKYLKGRWQSVTPTARQTNEFISFSKKHLKLWLSIYYIYLKLVCTSDLIFFYYWNKSAEH